jgi:hypothetical protein
MPLLKTKPKMKRNQNHITNPMKSQLSKHFKRNDYQVRGRNSFFGLQVEPIMIPRLRRNWELVVGVRVIRVSMICGERRGMCGGNGGGIGGLRVNMRREGRSWNGN